MKLLILLFSLLYFAFPAKAAQKDKLWYKVEPAQPKKEESTLEPYEFDSVESKKEDKQWRAFYIWSLKPKLNIGGGFLADKRFIENDDSKRWFFSSEVSFRQRAWHRLVAGALLTQNSNLLVSGSWHYTPSRRWLRAFYGVGAAISLFADSEFRSIVKDDRYFITASYGWELLLSQDNGLRFEAKAYAGTKYYGVHLLASYIWHL